MKLYLSSYQLGDNPDQLIQLIARPSARVAVIDNALDAITDADLKRIKLHTEMESMRSLGLHPEHIDLRNYFDDKDALFDKLTNFDAVWVRGGNSFILRKAMHYSGFDRVIDDLIKPGKLVYAGYSAALAVIAPSLRGVELVDDEQATAQGYPAGTIWEGYGLIDFYPLVHFQSDHPESESVDEELAYIKSIGVPHKTLRDGEVIIVNN